MIITSYRRKGDRSIELQTDTGESHIFRNEADAQAWMAEAGATMPEEATAPDEPAPPKKKAKRK